MGHKGDSDSELGMDDDIGRRRTTSQPVSYHQPNLNYTINPCYQPNGTEHNTTNRNEPYVILSLNSRRH